MDISVIITTLAGLFVIGLLLVLAGAAQHKLVFFRSFGDVLFSLLPWPVLGFGAQIAAAADSAAAQAVLANVVWICFGLCILAVIARSIRDNQNLPLGLLVGIYKILVAAFVLFVVLPGIFLDDDAAGSPNPLAWLLGLGIAFWLYKILVNGDAVLRRRAVEISRL